jgi:hypothetical protein
MHPNGAPGESCNGRDRTCALDTRARGGARAGGYNYVLHEAAFPVDLTFPLAVCATFFVSLLVLLYVIHHRLQARARSRLRRSQEGR